MQMIMRTPQTTPFNFVTDELIWEMTDVMKYWEEADFQDYELDEVLKTSEFDFMKGFPFQIEFNDGNTKVSLDGQAKTWQSVFDGQITESEIFERRVGQVCVYIGKHSSLQQYDYFIRYWGSRTGVFVSEKDFEVLKARAENELKSIKIAKVRTEKRKTRIYASNGGYQFYN